MRGHRATAAAAILLLGSIAIHGRAQTSARDLPASSRSRQTAPGGVIDGQVVDASTGIPIRRAHVRATTAEQVEVGEAYTDQHGRYQITNLPPGQYVVIGSKRPYLELAHGQTVPEGSAKPVLVTGAEEIRQVDVKLPRAGVVAGRVVDEDGAPVAYADVVAMRSQFVHEQYSWPAMGPSARTDDRGEYRIFGLEQGEYLVAATYRPIAAVERDATSPSYGMTYAPRTLRDSEARHVTIGIGTSKDHVNVTLVRVASAQIAGVAYGIGGRPMINGSVTLHSRSNPYGTLDDPADIKPDGSFALHRVAPGEYSLEADGVSQPDAPRQTAIANVVLSGHDVNGIRLEPPPHSVVSGRIVVEAGAAASLKTASIYLSVGTIDPHVVEVTTPRGGVRADLTFFAEVPPGLRNLRLIGLPLGLGMKAIRLNGIDITDAGFDVKPLEDIRNIEVELTAHPTRVSGTVTDRHGVTATECPVMVFARDDRKWGDVTRHFARGKTDSSGRFEISGLPPGEYAVAAAYGIPSFGWNHDPDLLRRIRKRAGRLSLREGQAAVVTLKLLGGP